MDFKKYGFSKSNPNYWINLSNAIWNDNGLSMDEKMEAQKQLVSEYQTEKRKQLEILEEQPPSDLQNIKNALGLAQGSPLSQLRDELARLKDKSEATWSAITKKVGLSKKEILEKYDIN